MIRITQTEAGHGFTLYRVACESGPLDCSIAEHTQYATVYRFETDKPVATLARRRVIAGGPNWRAYDTAGREIGSGFGGRLAALRAVAARENTKARESRAARVASAALWSAFRYGATA